LADTTFAADLEHFVEPLIPAGRVNSLAFVLLKLTAPGVPDLYRGTELWDLSLVDRDNRRPVDYALRSRLLAELDRLEPEAIMARADEGLPKLWLIRQALDVRRSYPRAFAEEGTYEPIEPGGARRDHLVVF